MWFATPHSEDAGVTHIFGGHGGALVPMVNAICKNPRVKWIYTRNEVLLGAVLAEAACSSQAVALIRFTSLIAQQPLITVIDRLSPTALHQLREIFQLTLQTGNSRLSAFSQLNRKSLPLSHSVCKWI